MDISKSAEIYRVSRVKPFLYSRDITVQMYTATFGLHVLLVRGYAVQTEIYMFCQSLTSPLVIFRSSAFAQELGSV